MALDVLSWKKEFLKRKQSSNEEAESTAQRLINIYRQLSALGPEANQQYNAMLLKDATLEVQIALKNIPGGEEIRDYLNFLKHQELSEEEESQALHEGNEALQIKNSLPAAEEMSPLWETYGTTVRETTTPAVIYSKSDAEKMTDQIVSLEAVVHETQKQNILSVIETQNERVLDVLKYIVIDSDVDKMHENLKNGIAKAKEVQAETVQQVSEALKKEPLLAEIREKLTELFEKQTAQTLAENEAKEAARKKENKFSDKFRRTKQPTKFSVHLIDEEKTDF